MPDDNCKLIPFQLYISFYELQSKVQETASDASQVQYMPFKPNQEGVKMYIER